MGTSMISLSTTDAATCSLHLAASLLVDVSLCTFFILSLALLTELGAEVIRDLLEEGCEYPSSETQHAGNEPVITVKTSSGDLHSIATKLNDYTLCCRNE